MYKYLNVSVTSEKRRINRVAKLSHVTHFTNSSCHSSKN